MKITLKEKPTVNVEGLRAFIWKPDTCASSWARIWLFGGDGERFFLYKRPGMDHVEVESAPRNLESLIQSAQTNPEYVEVRITNIDVEAL